MFHVSQIDSVRFDVGPVGGRDGDLGGRTGPDANRRIVLCRVSALHGRVLFRRQLQRGVRLSVLRLGGKVRELHQGRVRFRVGGLLRKEIRRLGSPVRVGAATGRRNAAGQSRQQLLRRLPAM
jgi:hypothetical protein